MRETIKTKRKKQRRRKIAGKIFGCLVLLGVLAVVCIARRTLTERKLRNLPEDEYPKELVELLEKNPETEEFVLGYPQEKGKNHRIDLSKYKNCNQVPHFLQWDKRWGYEAYGNSMIGISGCGPTCLSMVAVYLLHDTDMSPKWMAEYSMENGYYEPGKGTSWALMTEGAAGIGLNAKELPLDEQRIIDNLVAGNPIICSVGPGDFTTEGHYIVLTGYKNGEVRVNDPNSNIRTEKRWKLDKITGQIKNLWVYWR